MVLWDINHRIHFNGEEEFPNEVLVVQTRRKFHVTKNHPIISQAPKKLDSIVPLVKLAPILKSPPKFTTPETSKLEYNVVEELKKMKASILVMDLCRIPP